VVAPDRLGLIAVPALVAAWAKDPILHPIAVARRIAELLPDAEFVEMVRPSELTPQEAGELMSGWVADLWRRALP
jgi:pimeloyl-ACP methyl ester carboxylesterase